MKRFPKIRLSGDKDLATTFIRRGKIELQRTKKLRDQMGVPVYQRVVPVDDHTTIRILLEKDQEFIYIETISPEEEKVIEEKEEEKEEKELCIPGFIVYRNKYAHLESYGLGTPRPVHAGYKLIYTGRAWELDAVPDTHKYGAQAAWWHLDKNLDKYYSRKGLSRCDLVTWDDNLQSIFRDPSSSSSTALSGTSMYFYFQGLRGSIIGGTNPVINSTSTQHYILGACLLPAYDLKADYFYALVRYNAPVGVEDELIVRRIRRELSNPDVLTSGASQTVVRITYSSIIAALPAGCTGLSIDSCAYVDEGGTAYLMAHAHYSSSPPSGWSPAASDRSGGYLCRLKVNLYTGEFEVSQDWNEASVKVHAFATHSYTNFPVARSLGYGAPYTQVNSSMPYETDIVRSEGVKLPEVDMVIRKPAPGKAYRSTTWQHPKPSLVAVLGGYDANYEFRIKFTASGISGEGEIVSHHMQVSNADYDPGADSGTAQWPWAPHFYYSEETVGSGMTISADLILYRNDEEIWRLEVYNYQQGAWSCRKENVLNPAREYGFAYPNWNPDPPWDLTQNSAYDERQPSNQLIVKGSSYAVRRSRELTCFHPMVPEVLGYMEYTAVIPSSSTDVATWTAVYFFMGQKRWEVVFYEWAGNLDNLYWGWDAGSGFDSSRTVSPSTGISRSNSYAVEYSFYPQSQVVTLGSPVIQTSYIFDVDTEQHNATLLNDVAFGPLGYIIGPAGVNTDIATHLRIYEKVAPQKNYRYTNSTLNHYTRHTHAVHKKSVGPNRNKHPYFFQVLHPSSEQLTSAGFLSLPVWNPGVTFDKQPDSEFISNCITLEQIKALTGEDGVDKEYPVDFGVI